LSKRQKKNMRKRLRKEAQKEAENATTSVPNEPLLMDEKPEISEAQNQAGVVRNEGLQIDTSAHEQPNPVTNKPEIDEAQKETGESHIEVTTVNVRLVIEDVAESKYRPFPAKHCTTMFKAVRHIFGTEMKWITKIAGGKEMDVENVNHVIVYEDDGRGGQRQVLCRYVDYDRQYGEWFKRNVRSGKESTVSIDIVVDTPEDGGKLVKSAEVGKGDSSGSEEDVKMGLT
jgi:hypothetical protein